MAQIGTLYFATSRNFIYKYIFDLYFDSEIVRIYLLNRLSWNHLNVRLLNCSERQRY